MSEGSDIDIHGERCTAHVSSSGALTTHPSSIVYNGRSFLNSLRLSFATVRRSAYHTPITLCGSSIALPNAVHDRVSSLSCEVPIMLAILGAKCSSSSQLRTHLVFDKEEKGISESKYVHEHEASSR